MPLRVTAKDLVWLTLKWGLLYYGLCVKMIDTRTTHLQPSNNHPSRKVTIINLINYDLYQYVESEKPPTTHLSQQVSIHNTNTHILNSKIKKSIKEDYKKIGDEGHYWIILKDKKK